MAIQLRRGQTSLWETQNPTLEAGQIGVEIRDSEPDRFKIGDGTTNWQGLEYSTPDPAIYRDNKIQFSEHNNPSIIASPMSTTITSGYEQDSCLEIGSASMYFTITNYVYLSMANDVIVPGENVLSLGRQEDPWKNIYSNKVTIGSLALVYDSDANSINVENA